MKTTTTTTTIKLPEGGLVQGKRYKLKVPDGLRLFSSDGGQVVLDEDHGDGTATVHVLGAPVTSLVCANSKRQGSKTRDTQKKQMGEQRKAASVRASAKTADADAAVSDAS